MTVGFFVLQTPAEVAAEIECGKFRGSVDKDGKHDLWWRKWKSSPSRKHRPIRRNRNTTDPRRAGTPKTSRRNSAKRFSGATRRLLRPPMVEAARRTRSTKKCSRSPSQNSRGQTQRADCRRELNTENILKARGRCVIERLFVFPITESFNKPPK